MVTRRYRFSSSDLALKFPVVSRATGYYGAGIEIMAQGRRSDQKHFKMFNNLRSIKRIAILPAR